MCTLFVSDAITSMSTNIHFTYKILKKKKNSITFFQNLDVFPTRFHVVRIIILSINTKFKVMRGSPTTRRLILENPININPNLGIIHIMNYVQLEPFVIYVWDNDRSLVICKGTIVNPKHQGCGMWASSKHLHDTHARRATWHVPITFELPDARRVIVSLKK